MQYIKKASLYLILFMISANVVHSAEVGVNSQFSEKATLVLEEKLLDDKVIHGFYAINSNTRFNQMIEDKSINNFDHISFGWSTIDEENGEVFLTQERRLGDQLYDYYRPEGSDEVLNNMKSHSIDSSLMVYAPLSQFEDNFGTIFREKEIMNQIILAALDFNAVTIDFEFVNQDYQQSYLQFLRDLKAVLEVLNKQLYVTVPVSTNYNHYQHDEIFQIADYVILMAHDYEAKWINGFYGNEPVLSPQSPINTISQDISRIKGGLSDSSLIEKGLLQISFASTQWENINGYVDGQAYHPTYSMIYDRALNEVITNKQAYDTIVRRGESSLNPYILYTNKETGNLNTIWYEDWTSVESKLKLVKEQGLGGISLWYIGSIPNYYSGEIDLELDVWNRLGEEIR
ncbi:glycosyl hydrolase family 18 protein [Vallitalea okinawensis]|uniref:glycosyl hydrolase family 18 protein n=1 Tax=Vallitalea okinawensis TaxID=2078660 RepID=UPI000CFDBAD5|nr:glycosyl hydrolase family 18 protein [Vallitalea okinawensis]